MELRKGPIPLHCELTLGVVLKASINGNVREHVSTSRLTSKYALLETVVLFKECYSYLLYL